MQSKKEKSPSSHKLDDIFAKAKKKRRIEKVKEKLKALQKEKEAKKQKERVKQIKEETKQLEGLPQRRKTKDGLTIYTEEELNIGKGGTTADCPFDCDCCF